MVELPAEDVLLSGLNRNLGELAEQMGVRFTAVGETELVATMPVAGNRQPMLLLHGGANAVLAETLGSVQAHLLGPPELVPVGIELSCTHHRAATEGLVTAVGRPINVGRTLATIGITITDDRGRPTCTARLTCLYRSAPDGYTRPRSFGDAGGP